MISLIWCALAPWVFWTGQYVSKFRFLDFLAATDFQRFFDRSVLISAFLLLIPVVRWIGTKRFNDLGLIRDPDRLEHLIGGFLVSLGTIAALGGLLLAAGGLELKNPIPWHLLHHGLTSGFVDNGGVLQFTAPIRGLSKKWGGSSSNALQYQPTWLGRFVNTSSRRILITSKSTRTCRGLHNL